MLAAGVQHKRPKWIGLNLLVLVVVPLLTMAIAWAISWPSSHGAKSTKRRT
jgi:hypothetical protein